MWNYIAVFCLFVCFFWALFFVCEIPLGFYSFKGQQQNRNNLSSRIPYREWCSVITFTGGRPFPSLALTLLEQLVNFKKAVLEKTEISSYLAVVVESMNT